MGLSISSGPSVEPISVSEARTRGRIDTTAADADISQMIATSRQWVESAIWRQLVNATYVLKLRHFPCAELVLPRPPLSSVTSIQYLDINGATQTFSSSDYDVLTDLTPGEVRPAYNEVWPTTRDIHNAVTVTYVAGYGATAASVPAIIRDVIMSLVADRYHVGFVTEQTMRDARRLLAPYMVRDDRIAEVLVA